MPRPKGLEEICTTKGYIQHMRIRNACSTTFKFACVWLRIIGMVNASLLHVLFAFSPQGDENDKHKNTESSRLTVQYVDSEAVRTAHEVVVLPPKNCKHCTLTRSGLAGRGRCTHDKAYSTWASLAFQQCRDGATPRIIPGQTVFHKGCTSCY